MPDPIATVKIRTNPMKAKVGCGITPIAVHAIPAAKYANNGRRLKYKSFRNSMLIA
jgi:hypothetical protein